MAKQSNRGFQSLEDLKSLLGAGEDTAPPDTAVTIPGMVYSTAGLAAGATAEPDTPPPAEQDLRLTLNKRLKGGKQATVIYQFQGSEAALEALAKALKTHCGVGGSAKEGEIILQGNVLKPAQEYLRSKGYRFKLAGV